MDNDKGFHTLDHNSRGTGRAIPLAYLVEILSGELKHLTMSKLRDGGQRRGGGPNKRPHGWSMCVNTLSDLDDSNCGLKVFASSSKAWICVRARKRSDRSPSGVVLALACPLCPPRGACP